VVMQIRCVFVEVRTFLKDGVELDRRRINRSIYIKKGGNAATVRPLESQCAKCSAADHADPPAVCLVTLLSAVRLKKKNNCTIGRKNN
jgi:hypothetical protein